MSAVGGSVLQVIPAKAAEFAHQAVHNEKSASPAGKYAPKYFSPHQYEMLTTLCDTIIPKDEKSGGAVEAGAPEFIDLLTSENEEWQLALGGGLQWLDGFCSDRYSNVFLDCTPEQRKEVLDLIAFRKNAKTGFISQPGSGLFRFPARAHLRRLLHQQNRHRGFAVHRKHRAPRVPGLPAAAGGLNKNCPGRATSAAIPEQFYSQHRANPCADRLIWVAYLP